MPDIAERSTRKLLVKTTAYTLLILNIFLFLTIMAIGLFVYSKASTFITTADTSVSQLYSLYKENWDKPVTQTNNHKNVLVLGVDSLENRGDVPPLTDTMMLVSIDLETAHIKMLPLPRDLWDDAYQTKINALLAYGYDKNSDQPEIFPQEVIAQLTNVDIHHTLVVNLNSLAELIDLLGGVEVDIPIGFIDHNFPRSDVDITTETDPEKLYQTVSFEKGKEVMSGERALQYIRSRKSEDDQGTDLARSERQQQVVLAIIAKVQSRQVLSDPTIMGKLFKFYKQKLSKYFPLEELIPTAKKLLPERHNLTLTPVSISVYPDQEDGVIWHPPVWQYNNLWVYEIRDLETFQKEVTNKLD